MRIFKKREKPFTVKKVTKDGILHCTNKPTRSQTWGHRISLWSFAIFLIGLLSLHAMQIDFRNYLVRQAEAQVEQRDQQQKMAKATYCLARTLYWEAASGPRGEGDVTDMLAIAQNVVERAESTHYADTVCGVVNEVRTSKVSGQDVAMYSYTFDRRGTPKGPKWFKAQTVASGVLNDWATNGRNFQYYPEVRTLVAHSVNYHAEMANRPHWAKADVDECRLLPLGKIGAHYHYANFRAVDRTAWEECKLKRFAKTNGRHKVASR